jgi:hypothetical protein
MGIDVLFRIGESDAGGKREVAVGVPRFVTEFYLTSCALVKFVDGFASGA